MPTRTMTEWRTSIAHVVSTPDEEEVIVRGHRLSDLIGGASFAEVMFLMLQGRMPAKPEARVLDALLVASIEHGIAPPSMISRCFASYGTSIQAAVGGGILAFGDAMGGLGEQLAKLMVESLGDLDPADDLLAAKARQVVAETEAQGERLPGFGIPLHGADPRAPKVLEVAKAEGTFGPYCRFACLLEDELSAQRGGRRVPMNLDGVSAAVILDLGFPWASTRLFLLTSRSVSMGAHFLEEQEQGSTWRHIPAEQITYTP